MLIEEGMLPENTEIGFSSNHLWEHLVGAGFPYDQQVRPFLFPWTWNNRDLNKNIIGIGNGY